MKISVVARHPNPQTRQIQEEARKVGVEFELVNIDNLTRVRERIDSLGEVVIWRTAFLDIGVGRTAFLTRLMRKRVVINSALATQPYVAHKFYQQKLVEPLKTIISIPTYYFKSKKRLLTAIENGVLRFPLVMKADLGARGEKVYLVKDNDDLKNREVDVRDYVFQNYIKNNGDYRVLVLGGVALGVMKRIAHEGEFRNNISQGGSAVDATNFPEAEELMEKAVTVASLFGLHFCGVDFIRDEETGEFRFLEVNTVAQWQGFNGATGINVAAQLVAYCMAMGRREEKNKKELVEDYMKLFLIYLPLEKRLHYLSRIWLWTKGKFYRDKLDEIKDNVVGKGKEGVRERIVSLIKEAEEDQRHMAVKEATQRRNYYLQFPLLGKVNNLLFFWLMAKTIYGVEVRENIAVEMADREIVRLRDILMEDEKAVRHLSTAAVNFFYLTSEYLSLPRPDVKWLISILTKHGSNEKQDLKTALYLLTHIVIGESLFYTRDIGKVEEVKNIIKKAEKMIGENYFALSLDMKLEFLVCCRLGRYGTDLEKIILSEAERSFSPLGNFLVDTHNDWRNRHTHKLVQAEHRNTLYLMAGSKM